MSLLGKALDWAFGPRRHHIWPTIVVEQVKPTHPASVTDYYTMDCSTAPEEDTSDHDTPPRTHP
jgi:hypothetical protein